MANIYTNLASHKSTFTPTEQKLPFQAYAGVGAHQQQRTDKLLKEASEMGLDIGPMKYDVDETSNLLKGFQQEQQNIVDNFDNTSDADVVSQVNKLRLRKNMAGKPGTPEYNINKRNEVFTSNNKKATTASGNDFNKKEWFGLNADLSGQEASSSQNEDGTFNEVPELNFQNHVNGAAFTKLGNDILLRKSNEILKPEEIGIVEKIINSSDINGDDLQTTMSFIQKSGAITGKKYNKLYSDLLNQLATPQNKKSLSDEVDAEYYQYLKQQNNYLPEEEQLTSNELRDEVLRYQQGDIGDPNFQGGLTSQEYANEKLKSKVGSMADISTTRQQNAGILSPLPGQSVGGGSVEEEEEDLVQWYYTNEPTSLTPGAGNFDVGKNIASLKTKKDQLQQMVDKANKKRNPTQGPNGTTIPGSKYGMDDDERRAYVKLKKQVNTDELYIQGIEESIYKNTEARELAMNEKILSTQEGMDENQDIAAIFGVITAPWESKKIGWWNKAKDGKTILTTEDEWIKDRESSIEGLMRRAVNSSDDLSWKNYFKYNILSEGSVMGEERMEGLGSKLRGMVNEQVNASNSSYIPHVISDSAVNPGSNTMRAGAVSKYNNIITNTISNNPAGYRVVGAQNKDAAMDLSSYMATLNERYNVPFRVVTEKDKSGMAKGGMAMIPREGESPQVLITLAPDFSNMTKERADQILSKDDDFFTSLKKGIGMEADIEGYTIKIPVTSLGVDNNFNNNINQMADNLYKQGLNSSNATSGNEQINDARFIKANLSVGHMFASPMLMEKSDRWVPEFTVDRNGNEVYNEESGLSQPVPIDYLRHPTEGDLPLYIQKVSNSNIGAPIYGRSGILASKDDRFRILDHEKVEILEAGSIKDLEVKWYEYLGSNGLLQDQASYVDMTGGRKEKEEEEKGK